jgi:hypothetical protein
MSDGRRTGTWLTRWGGGFTPLIAIQTLLCATGLTGLGAVYPPPAQSPESTSSLPAELGPDQNPLREIAPGVYGLGMVRLDREKRAISFPGAVNMDKGHVEYALVHSTGKVHESVLRSEVEPFQIHLARLLISKDKQAPAAVEQKAPRELRGPPVVIRVSWQAGAEKKQVRMEELIFNLLTKSRMSHGPWIYGGSRIIDGKFLAQRDGSIISIISDPDALVNNPRPGRHDDEIWTVNSGLIPPVGTPVEITIEQENHSEE